MTAIERIRQSAQAGMRHFAAAHLPGQPDDTVPHKRVPRRVLHAQDKQSCRRAEIDPDYRYCFRQWRHARRPRHAKEGAERRAKQKALRTAATELQGQSK